MGLKMGAGSSTAGAGELQVISIIASSAPGLSPLARGTLSVGGSLDLRGGLSPLARGTQCIS